MATKKKARKKKGSDQPKPTPTGEKLQVTKGKESPSSESSTSLAVRNSLYEEAKKADGEVRKYSDFIKRRWSDIGKICSDVRDKNLFKYLKPPFNDLLGWAESCEVGRSTMYRCIRIYGALKMLPHKDLLKMTSMNAEHLARLPLDTRKDPAWIKRAQTMTERKFEELVEKELPKKARDASAIDKLVPLIIKMYEGQKVRILESIDEHGTNTGRTKSSDRGTLLEEICAEFSAGFTSDTMAVLKKITRAFAGHLQLEHSKFAALSVIFKGELPADEQLKLCQTAIQEVAESGAEVTKGFGEQLMLEGMEENVAKSFKKAKKEKANGATEKKNGHAPVANAGGDGSGTESAKPVLVPKEKADTASA